MKKFSSSNNTNGGTGKTRARRQGENLTKYGENLMKIKSKGRKMKCLDCNHFKGIDPVGIAKCAPEGNKHKGLDICEENFLSEYSTPEEVKEWEQKYKERLSGTNPNDLGFNVKPGGTITFDIISTTKNEVVELTKPYHFHKKSNKEL